MPRGLEITVAVLVVAWLEEFTRRTAKFWKKYKTDKRRDLEKCEIAVREWDLLDSKKTLDAVEQGVTC
jgi:hypothetical protein